MYDSPAYLSSKELDIILEKTSHLFNTLSLLNRLDMEFKLDVCIVELSGLLIAIVKAHEGFHRSIVSKNSEQIAFQLRKKFLKSDMDFSMVEYNLPHDKDNSKAEWWQWRFNWVGSTPLQGQRYLLSLAKIRKITDALEQQAEIKIAG